MKLHPASNQRHLLRRGRASWPTAISVAIAGLGSAVPAWSQDAAAAPPAAASAPDAQSADAATPRTSEATSLESVVITARKRSERLQDVPLSITAITAATIEKAGLRNLQDVTNLTSNLSMFAAGAEAQLGPVIRGLTNLNGGSGDPNVAVFLDGIYLVNSSAFSLGLIAIERVEIVKGPVSALYGRNAFAGAINYVSKTPPDKLEGDVEVGISSSGGRLAKASIGMPISPGMLSAQLSLGIDKSDGTWKDSVTGARGGGYDKRDGMLSLRLTPTSALTIDGSVYYGDDKFDIVPFGIAPNNCGSRTPATAPVNASAFRQRCGRFEFPEVQVPAFKGSAGATGNSREVISERLRANYDFGGLDASLLFGYNDVKQTRFNDFTGLRDGIPYALANAATPATPNGNILFSNELFGNVLTNTDRQLELRIASKQNQPVRWAVGYNYYDADFSSRTIVGVDSSALPPGQIFANVAGLPFQQLWATPDGSVSPGQGLTTGTDRVLSPFGSIDWDITPQLTLLAELRHTKQSKEQTIFSTTSSLVPPVNTAGNGTNTSDKDYSFNNYRTSLRYKFSDDLMAYASLANGTKAGGFNSRATIAEDVSFDPETNRTYELGSKLGLLGRKLQVGVAVFHVDTGDIQINGPAAAANNPGFVVKNFGGTISNGFEFDIAALPVEGLTLNAGIGFANSRFKASSYDFTVSAADCAAIPGCSERLVTFATPSGNRTAFSLGGLRVPRSSRVTAFLSAQYEGDLTERWGWFVRGDYRYESTRQLQNTNWGYIPDRHTVNLRAGLADGRFRFTAFVNNVTNDDTPEGAQQNVRLNDFTGPYAGAMPPRRTFGVTGAVSF